MGAGTQTTTQNTTAQPYGKAKPLINQALSDALNAYKQGVGSSVFTGSTVIPFARQTMQGMGGTMQTANWNANNPNGMTAQSKDIIRQGGLNDAQMGALKQMQQTAGSSYNMNANPGFADVLKKVQQDTAQNVNMNAAAAGRYGSGIHEGVLGREIGNVTNQMVSNDYNNWLGRRDAAVGNVFNAGQTGQQNMAGAYNNMNLPNQSRMAVGSMYEDLAKRQMDDRLRIFNEKQNGPWDQIGRLMGVGNLTSSYAPRSTTSTAPGPNPLLQTLGMVSTGAGLLGGLPSWLIGGATGGASGGGGF